MNSIITALGILTMSLASAAATPLMPSAFDTTAEGWTAVGDVTSFGHQAAGGLLGGWSAPVAEIAWDAEFR